MKKRTVFITVSLAIVGIFLAIYRTDILQSWESEGNFNSLLGTWIISPDHTIKSIKSSPKWDKDAEKFLPTLLKYMAKIYFTFENDTIIIHEKGEAIRSPIMSWEKQGTQYRFEISLKGQADTFFVSKETNKIISVRTASSNDLAAFRWRKGTPDSGKTESDLALAVEVMTTGLNTKYGSKSDHDEESSTAINLSESTESSNLGSATREKKTVPTAYLVDPVDTPIQIENNFYVDDVSQRICKLGRPIFVSRWSGDETGRWLVFKGPFIDESNEIKSYYVLYLTNIEATEPSSSFFTDSVAQYLEDIIPGELDRFNIPIIQGVSDISSIESLLGRWDAEHKRIGNKKRVVYEKTVCVKGKLLVGAYFDLQGNAIVKANGIQHPERLQRHLYDLRTYSDESEEIPDEMFIQYGDRPIKRNGAKNTLLRFIVLKEFGLRDEAWSLISQSQHDFNRMDKLASASVEGSMIDASTISYRGLEFSGKKAQIQVQYYLKDQSFHEHTYTMVRFGKEWLVYE